MATIKPLANSIWPNALKTDSEGYVIFYPLGTNKVDINTVKWPKGDKLITPFLYEGEVDKLVGFVDTKSLEISGENSIIYLPYKHIEIQFPSIEKGTLQIHAPNATTKKVSWSDDVFEDIPEAQFKYKGCRTVVDVRIVDADFKTNDIVDGVWSEPLWDLENGDIAFKDCITLNTFSSDLPSLTNGEAMFSNCYLTSFSSDLSSLEYGEYMFSDCNILTTFSSDLPSLTNGSYMFDSCIELSSFSSDLSSLTNGSYMFVECSNLSSFTSGLPSLTNGEDMFRSCTNLTLFNGDLSSLVNGDGMFYSCGNLTSFSSDLSGLVSGNTMFSQCKLDAESVMNVAHSIKNITAEKQLYIDGVIPYVTYDSSTNKYSAPRGFMSDGSYVYTYHTFDSFTTTINSTYVGKLTLAINVTKDSTTIQQLEDFAQEAAFDSWEELKQAFVDKGWTDVTFQYGGTSDSITYGLRGGEQIIPCPIYAKLVESDKDSAEYCTEDASSFYNIDWGHDVTDTTGYTQFNSLEEAISTYNVIPKN